MRFEFKGSHTLRHCPFCYEDDRDLNSMDMTPKGNRYGIGYEAVALTCECPQCGDREVEISGIMWLHENVGTTYQDPANRTYGTDRIDPFSLPDDYDSTEDVVIPD